ncbi:MAG: hypothetical protein LBS82_01520, partial [Spirochaetaceae bacterium]|nr:hypothetical protein [Spirochaetaceae bacterium]
MRKAMLVLLAGFAFAACDVERSFMGVEGGSSPLLPQADVGAFVGGASAADAAGVATLSMAFAWDGGAAAARQAVGADGGQIEGGVGVGKLRNCFQLILVDLSAPGRIWDFDERMSAAGDPRPRLQVGFLTGHTYGILVLMGHREGSEPPSLLASGFLKKSLAAGENGLVMPLTPIVVGAEFARYGDSSDVRRCGRLARTVGLDANTVYALVYTLGSASRYAGGRPGDALRVVSGDGVAPLREADKAAFHGLDDWVPADGLRLVSNFARYSFNPAGAAADVPDWYGAVRGGRCTNGVATYTVETGQAGLTAGSVFFNMVYAPFGLGDFAANWKDARKFSKPLAALPLWALRNGVNDAVQDEGTDFGAYDGTASHNGNGALSVGVADPEAPLAGLFEDDNPWPIGGPGAYWQDDGADAGDAKPTLQEALTRLNAALAAAGNRYGHYRIRVRGATAARAWSTDGADLSANRYPHITGANMLGNRKAGTGTAALSIVGVGSSTGPGPAAAVALREPGNLICLAPGAKLELAVDGVKLQGIAGAGHTVGPYAATVPATAAIVIPANPYNTTDDNNTALVYVGRGNVFEMLGGAELTGNWNSGAAGAAGRGGGAQVVGGVFRMTGDDAAVRHNYAGLCGGGVHLHGKGSTGLMSGAAVQISGNASGGGGGGAYVDGDASFVMEGENARISGNASDGAGGGAHIAGGASFTMRGSDSAISGNASASGGGGGAYATGGARFTMSGTASRISGNQAVGSGAAGGGVNSIGGAYFTMEAGEISGNPTGGAQPQFYGDRAGSIWPAGVHGSVHINGVPGHEFDMDAPAGGEMYATGSLGGTTYPNLNPATSVSAANWWEAHQSAGTVIRAAPAGASGGASGGTPGGAPSAILVSGITLDKTSVMLDPPSYPVHSTTLTATVTPANATNPTLSWSSSNPTGVSVGSPVVGADGKVSVTVTALVTGA